MPDSCPRIAGEVLAELARIGADLEYLAEHGALAGVSEVITERRRQIEVKGYSADHDREHPPSWFKDRSARELLFGRTTLRDAFAVSAALSAAGIDLLATWQGAADEVRRA